MKTKKKRNRMPEARESVFPGFLLVPIYKDTRIDLKTEKECVVKGQNKIIKNKK